MRTTSCWATCASLLQLCHLAQCQHRCLCRSVPPHHPRRCELGARRQPRQIKCCYAVGAGQGCECRAGLCSDPVDSACHHHQPLAYPPSARLSITSTTTTVAPGARVHLPGLLLTTQLCTVHAHVHIHIHTHTITPLCIVYARAQTHTHTRAHTQTPAHVRVHAVVAPLMLLAGVAGLEVRLGRCAPWSVMEWAVHHHPWLAAWAAAGSHHHHPARVLASMGAYTHAL